MAARALASAPLTEGTVAHTVDVGSTIPYQGRRSLGGHTSLCTLGRTVATHTDNRVTRAATAVAVVRGEGSTSSSTKMGSKDTMATASTYGCPKAYALVSVAALHGRPAAFDTGLPKAAGRSPKASVRTAIVSGDGLSLGV